MLRRLQLLKKQATLRLRQIERDIAQTDAAIEMTISADKTLSEKADILITHLPNVENPIPNRMPPVFLSVHLSVQP